MARSSSVILFLNVLILLSHPSTSILAAAPFQAALGPRDFVQNPLVALSCNFVSRDCASVNFCSKFVNLFKSFLTGLNSSDLVLARMLLIDSVPSEELSASLRLPEEVEASSLAVKATSSVRTIDIAVASACCCLRQASDVSTTALFLPALSAFLTICAVSAFRPSAVAGSLPRFPRERFCCFINCPSW